MLSMESTMGKFAREARRMTAMPGQTLGGDDGKLTETTSFGADPGGLRMLSYIPEGLPEGAPLVVVLHGCTQTASGYDRAAGWSELARRQGFAVLLPEQRQCNNTNRCFNWFEPADTARGQGEVGSIHAMVQHALRVNRLDRGRVFVTGLSAGGAMTAALLATYPDIFAAGAIIAGLPFGCASSTQEAFERMMKPRRTPARELGARVRAASAHPGPWPRVAVWHGTADTVVRPANADESVRQWLDVHGLGEAGFVADRLDGQPRRTWRGADGQVRVELVQVEGLGHATPIAPGAADPSQRCGAPAPHVQDAGISSTARIAAFFGIAPPAEEAVMHGLVQPEMPRQPRRPAAVSQVINDALRAAGLLKGR